MLTVFLLFLYFAKANSMIVPEWLLNLTWALVAGSWLIRMLATMGKKKE